MIIAPCADLAARFGRDRIKPRADPSNDAADSARKDLTPDHGFAMTTGNGCNEVERTGVCRRVDQ